MWLTIGNKHRNNGTMVVIRLGLIRAQSKVWEEFQTCSSLFSRDRAILLAFRFLQYCDRVHEVKPCSAE